MRSFRFYFRFVELEFVFKKSFRRFIYLFKFVKFEKRWVRS